MTKADIIRTLPDLSPDERKEIRARLNELDKLTDDEWDDDGELTPAEKQMIEERVADLDKNPATSIPWREAEARLKAR